VTGGDPRPTVAVGPIDLLAFALEVASLVAVAAGVHARASGTTGLILGIAAAVVWAVVWGLVFSPRAPARPSPSMRAIGKLVMFAVAAAAAWVAWGWAAALVIAVVAIVVVVVDWRRPTAASRPDA